MPPIAQPQVKTPIVDPQVAALWKVGFIQAIDVIMLLIMAGSTFTFFVWCMAQHTMTLAAYIVYFSVMNLTGLAWILLVVFRACMFSLKTRANLETLPEQAAALLHNFLQQGVSEAKNPIPEPQKD